MAKGLVKLHMPKGTDEVNFGTHSYPVDHDGEVEVPASVAEPLLKEGGAEDITEEEAVTSGGQPEIAFVKIWHQCPGTSVTVNHVSYTAGEDGTVMVPPHVVAHAEPFGFSLMSS